MYITGGGGILTDVNHRKFSRSKVEATAMLVLRGLQPIEVMLLDVSMNGIFLKTDLKLELGACCHVNILLGHIQHELPIGASGVVVRVHEEGGAIRLGQGG